ncbi:hypothetical protein [Flavobacterium weaverense]|uniref:hypothetical protein n=1 Tax=Flavobacterium weaverense TaxID=271156 RepID=UPI00147293B4|nr:hypothetical protein [Flavobacterium weaverense]
MPLLSLTQFCTLSLRGTKQRNHSGYSRDAVPSFLGMTYLLLLFLEERLFSLWARA